VTVMMSPSRRSVLLGLTAGAVASPAYIRPGWARGQRLVVCNFGGEEGIAKRRAFYDPFTKATGIEIITASGVDLAKMKIQVEHNDVQWDVVDMLEGWIPAAARMGLLERVDESIVNREGIIPQAKHAFAVGRSVYASGIAFPTNRLNGKVPKTWPEFWNTRAIPGRRGLRNRITETLEIALMADGVPPSQVYPCDVERGFKALERIKPYVAHWIAQTQQTVALIQRDEVDFTFTYTSRVKKLQEVQVPIGYSFRQNILGVAFSGALRGTKNKDAAMRLLAFMLKPDRQIEFANLYADAPTQKDALVRVDPRVRKWMPDISNPDNLFTNAAWWDGRVDELNIRFKEWLLV
jgi:putative spermidine/putrescine transport system substrate-binding protein